MQGNMYFLCVFVVYLHKNISPPPFDSSRRIPRVRQKGWQKGINQRSPEGLRWALFYFYALGGVEFAILLDEEDAILDKFADLRI